MEFENPNLQKALQLRKEGNPESLLWLNKACEEGDGKALFFKGDALEYGGFFLEQDEEEAQVFYELSANRGCPWGMAECAYSEELLWRDKIFESKDDYACAVCFHAGLGVDESDKKAREYVERAIRQENPMAQVLYACMSDSMEEFWLQKAAIFGYPEAQCMLGCALEERGLKKEALFWFLQGAKQKHKDSYYNVAFCYKYGSGCEINRPLSAVYFLKYGGNALILNNLMHTHVEQKELFIYGRDLKYNHAQRAMIGESTCAKAIQVYTERTDSARKAALCFIWICRHNQLLYPDLRGLIAKMIFDSREYI